MKKILLFSVVIFLIVSGCMSNRNIHEDTMYVTRKYCGEFDTLRYSVEKSFIIKTNVTYIKTSEEVLSLVGRIPLDIEKGDRCYVKYIAESLPGSNTKIWVLYFTWDGTEDLYELRQNWITGQIN